MKYLSVLSRQMCLLRTVFLAEAVLKLARELQLGAELGERGADFVARRFDRELLAMEYLGVLEEVGRRAASN